MSSKIRTFVLQNFNYLFEMKDITSLLYKKRKRKKGHPPSPPPPLQKKTVVDTVVELAEKSIS